MSKLCVFYEVNGFVVTSTDQTGAARVEAIDRFADAF